MMTSRSEYRLLLRQDNADLRLTPIGYEAGLIPEAKYHAFLSKKALQDAEIERLERTHLSPAIANPFLQSLDETSVKSGVSLADLLRRPAVSYASLAQIDPDRPDLPRSVKLNVEVSIKYAGYANRQRAEVERRSRLEEKTLPADIDYKEIRGLRLEAAQKLNSIRPLTIGQASRISGVSPADVSVLLIYLGIK